MRAFFFWVIHRSQLGLGDKGHEGVPINIPKSETDRTGSQAHSCDIYDYSPGLTNACIYY